MVWEVRLRRKAEKQAEKLPCAVRASLTLLIREMENRGPIRGNWPNYGRLGLNRYHCHIKQGHPTYVAVWEVLDNEIRLIEVTYAGTHEKAPY
jgi:mRNA-degrading endonuclease RelE of RelBE toxin-antitoxin system